MPGSDAGLSEEPLIAPSEENCAQDREDQDREANVFCNVYDILPTVNSCVRLLQPSWGVYHTGVQVHGLEVSFGGHNDSSTGVFCAKPRSARGARFREQVPIGHTEKDPLELRQAVAEASQSWPGNGYDPFKRNCNHFADFLCQELTGHSAPAYTNKFTESDVVKGIFYRCLVPFGRCLERCRWLPEYFPGWPEAVSYAQDDVGGGADTKELGVSGAKGINQVLLEAATMQKEQANKNFHKQAYDEARQAYLKALSYIASLSRRTEDEDEVRKQAMIVKQALLLNVAACDLKMEEYDRVLHSCEQVLINDPENQKAFYRRGLALVGSGMYEEANADLRHVLQLVDKDDVGTQKDIRRELDRIKKLMDTRKQNEKELAKRMLGTSEDAVRKNSKNRTEENKGHSAKVLETSAENDLCTDGI